MAPNTHHCLFPDFCEEVFQARLAKVKASWDALQDMGDSQLAITLLRSCLVLPKISFVLRACPPSHIRHTAIDFDTAIRRSLESIAGGPMSDWSWQPQLSHCFTACPCCFPCRNFCLSAIGGADTWPPTRPFTRHQPCCNCPCYHCCPP